MEGEDEGSKLKQRSDKAMERLCAAFVLQLKGDDMSDEDRQEVEAALKGAEQSNREMRGYFKVVRKQTAA